jgi:phosphoglycerate kinase
MTDYYTLHDFEIQSKTVLIRVDFNLPLDKKTLEILDTTRIKHVLPTLQELTNKKAKTVILAHQGRQKSWDFTSLKQHAKALQTLLGKPVQFINDIYGEQAKNAIQYLQPGEILMLDNVRKFPGETEKKSAKEHAQSELVQTLSPLADLFVNDAFAAAHRAHCSLIGFTAVLPSCAGRLLEKELTTLEKVVQHPEKPNVMLFGGAKFSDIIVTIERLLTQHTADKILLTGLPANAFLKANGYNLGEENESILLEEGSPEQFKQIKTLYNHHQDAIILPGDFAVSDKEKRKEITLDQLPISYPLYDIGEQTIKAYKDVLSTAKTIFLSGPCGVFENPLFRKGTKEIFTHAANLDVFSIAGGGHTVAALEQLHLGSKISHISTGGGSLEKFMMGEKLPVIEALKQAKKRELVNIP